MSHHIGSEVFVIWGRFLTIFGFFENLIFTGFGEIWLLPLESHRNSSRSSRHFFSKRLFFVFFEILVVFDKILVYKLMFWTCIWCPGHVVGVLGRV